MPYKTCKLPEYPCTRDMWDVLKDESRPIVIYGMGNGADKLISRFDSLGIKFADIFASDGFVRGHSFHGIRVKSFSEIRETYPEFVIALSFASARDEVVSMLEEIDSEYDMFLPDMPVAEESVYFDKDFYNGNYEEILKAYELFEDEESKNCFAAMISYKLSGKIRYLLDAFSEREDVFSIINSGGRIENMIDCGAYNGDTAREAIKYIPSLKEIIAVEPDEKTYRKLEKYAEGEEKVKVRPINGALWSESTVGNFMSSGNRNSSVGATSSYEYKNREVDLITLDSICDFRADYIKYDVEGAETEALIGSSRTVESFKPTLLISVYHKSRDLFSLPLFVNEKWGGYKLYLRRKRCLPAWEIELIAISSAGA